jgi:DtxR family Mn-dependent transcriptional regulator
MIKRLSTKGVITYEKYYGVNISSKGKTDALKVIRKHRLWETFLVQKLDFNWDEVHEVAEQLEHIQSPLLIEKLEAFLGFPVVDPHGHPIPDKHGKLTEQKLIMPSELPIGRESMVKSVKDGASAFLQYLSKIGIYIGAAVQVIERVEFDGSLEILIDGKQKCFISRDASENLMVTE